MFDTLVSIDSIHLIITMSSYSDIKIDFDEYFILFAQEALLLQWILSVSMKHDYLQVI